MDTYFKDFTANNPNALQMEIISVSKGRRIFIVVADDDCYELLSVHKSCEMPEVGSKALYGQIVFDEHKTLIIFDKNEKIQFLFIKISSKKWKAVSIELLTHEF